MYFLRIHSIKIELQRRESVNFVCDNFICRSCFWEIDLFRDAILEDVFLEWPLCGRHSGKVNLGDAIFKSPFSGRHFRVIHFRGEGAILVRIILEWPFYMMRYMDLGHPAPRRIKEFAPADAPDQAQNLLTPRNSFPLQQRSLLNGVPKMTSLKSDSRLRLPHWRALKRRPLK